MDILPRIQTFTWQCLYNSIGVKDCLVRRGMLEDATCPICLRDPETILLALCDCRKIKPIWTQLGVKWAYRNFWSDNVQAWLESNGSMMDYQDVRIPPWRIAFLFAIWSIWKSRNQVVFNRKTQNPRLATEITSRAMELTFYAFSIIKTNRMLGHM